MLSRILSSLTLHYELKYWVWFGSGAGEVILPSTYSLIKYELRVGYFPPKSPPSP